MTTYTCCDHCHHEPDFVHVQACEWAYLHPHPAQRPASTSDARKRAAESSNPGTTAEAQEGRTEVDPHQWSPSANEAVSHAIWQEVIRERESIAYSEGYRAGVKALANLKRRRAEQ